MYVINEKGEKVKSDFFATDILSKIIQEHSSVIHESEVIAAFEELLRLNEIVAVNTKEEWRRFKTLVREEIRANGSYQMSTNIVEGLCAITREGVMHIAQVQIIVKFLLGKHIDWFSQP